MNNKTTQLSFIIKPLDIIVILIAIIITAFSIFHLTQNNNSNLKVYIDTPNGTYIYNLDTDKDLEFTGPLGITYITIKNNKAFFTDSPCANKICIHTAAAQKNGDWIACLPNRIFLRIEGKNNTEETSDLDAISE